MVYWRMGIWDRLGNVIKSYLNDSDEKVFGKSGASSSSGDPDLDAAFDELNDYLKQGKSGGTSAGDKGGAGEQAVPETLRPDFAELGVTFGASAEECKAAYKELLKTHHPDRHAGHPGNFKKATERTARINAAYDRIEQWKKQRAGSGE